MYEPIGKDIHVYKGEQPDPHDGIANLDKLGHIDRLEFVGEHDFTEVGTYTPVEIRVVYEDGSSDVVPITVKVFDREVPGITTPETPDNVTYTPIGQDIEVAEGQQVNPKAGVANLHKFPDTTVVKFQGEPDFTKPGEYKDVEIVLTYPDGTSNSVKVTVKVNAKTTEPIPTATPTETAPTQPAPTETEPTQATPTTTQSETTTAPTESQPTATTATEFAPTVTTAPTETELTTVTTADTTTQLAGVGTGQGGAGGTGGAAGTAATGSLPKTGETSTMPSILLLITAAGISILLRRRQKN